jgi:hypothetical protein
MMLEIRILNQDDAGKLFRLRRNSLLDSGRMPFPEAATRDRLRKIVVHRRESTPMETVGIGSFRAINLRTYSESRLPRSVLSSTDPGFHYKSRLAAEVCVVHLACPRMRISDFLCR